MLVNVPKAGNFTIKRSFAQHEFAAGNNSAVLDPETILEKNRPTSPWYDFAYKERTWDHSAAHLRTAHLITNVRTPYTRVLSAYLDKIARNDGNVHRQAFCASIGTDPEVAIGFREFLAIFAD